MKQRLIYIILALMIAVTALVPTIVLAQGDLEDLEQELIELLEVENFEEVDIEAVTELLNDIDNLAGSDQPDSEPPEEFDDSGTDNVVVVDVILTGPDLQIALAWNPEIDQPQSAQLTVEDGQGEIVSQIDVYPQQDAQETVITDTEVLSQPEGIEIISVSAGLENVHERGLQYQIVIRDTEGLEFTRYPYRLRVVCEDEENCSYELFGNIFTDAILITEEMDKALDEIEAEEPEDILEALVARYPHLRGDAYAFGLEKSIQDEINQEVRAAESTCTCSWTAVASHDPSRSTFFRQPSQYATVYKMGWEGRGAAHYFAAKSVGGFIGHGRIGTTKLTMKMRCKRLMGWEYGTIIVHIPGQDPIIIKIKIPIYKPCPPQCDGEVRQSVFYEARTNAETVNTARAIGYDRANYRVGPPLSGFSALTRSFVSTVLPGSMNDPDQSSLGSTVTTGQPSTAELNTHGIVWAWADASEHGRACAKVVNGFALYATATASCTSPQTVTTWMLGTHPSHTRYLWLDNHKFLDHHVCDRPLYGDLGDAPDSTNHSGSPMLAYPGIPASYPTVYDPSLAAPPGPIHWLPNDGAWLGKEVSLEHDADRLPDYDNKTNIDPPNDKADLDNFDDGVHLDTLSIPECDQTTFDYEVTSNVTGDFYVNVWFDFDRNGEWNSFDSCVPDPNIVQLVPEWAVQNQAITINSAGSDTYTTPSFAATGPTSLANPMWMRITLTQHKINAASSADGSGPGGGYRWGETEDYYLTIPPKQAKGEMCGTKWHDKNGNGIQDPGEAGLPDWTIEIYDEAGDLEEHVKTDANGEYCVILHPGVYDVFEAQQSGWSQTYPLSGNYNVVIESDKLLSDINFGNQKSTVCVGAQPSLSQAPNYHFTSPSKVAVASCYADSASEYVLSVLDISGHATAPTHPAEYKAPMYHHPDWTREKMGNIFGLTLDNAGNIYATATSAYNEYFFGLAGSSGRIYKIDRITGDFSTFATLPNDPVTQPALGNITYDPTSDQFYVSNMDNGLIYQLDSGGGWSALNTYDHGVTGRANAGHNVIQDRNTTNPADLYPGYTDLGRRVWAVEAYNGRLYYGVWWENEEARDSNESNEIWSIPLNTFPNGPARLEITMPAFTDDYSNPVSDISFSPDGALLAAEREISRNPTIPTYDAHESRVLEFVWNGSAWVASPNTFEIGDFGRKTNSAGGVDYDYAPNGWVWSTGDALSLDNSGTRDAVYGLQGSPPTLGTIGNSTITDLNGIYGTGDKTQIGDVEVACPSGDLGDAPDSTNHTAGATMPAYPGTSLNVDASYPTVYDVTAPDVHGPRHWRPSQSAWLGDLISLEQDADILPLLDQDGITNISNSLPDDDLDKADDGVHLDTLTIPECGETTFDYDVYSEITGKLYLNVWFDFDRTGDWKGSEFCDRGNNNLLSVSDWAVQNHEINVIATGKTRLTTPKFSAMNPPSSDRPMWMRITLSEQPAPQVKSTSGFIILIPADGRGPTTGYNLGETEDYYLTENGGDPTESKICGMKWHDLNQDGIKNANEPGLPDWSITFKTEDGTVLKTLVTDEDGNYCCDDLQPGNYVVSEEIASGWVQTYPGSPDEEHHVEIEPGQTFNDIDFGNVLEPTPTPTPGIVITPFEDDGTLVAENVAVTPNGTPQEIGTPMPTLTPTPVLTPEPTTKQGDVNCDGSVGSVDGLFALQYDIGQRDGDDQCPEARQERTLYLPSCDVNDDGLCGSVDALFMLQCDIGRNNPLCPAATTFDTGENTGADSTAQQNSAILHMRRPAIANMGDTFTIAVNAESEAKMGALTASMGYDPAQFEFVDCQTVKDDRFTSAGCNLGTRDGEENRIIFNAAMPDGVSGSLPLAEITFTHIGTAVNMDGIDLKEHTFTDIKGNPLVVTITKNSNMVYLPAIMR